MIGVIAKKSERHVVEEFFELFKTPWEYYRVGRDYDVVLATNDFTVDVTNVPVVIVFASGEIRSGHEPCVGQEAQKDYSMLVSDGVSFPVYGGTSSGDSTGRPVLTAEGSDEIVGVEVETDRGHLFRIGYDLFKEVEILLSSGQPPECAHIPTLDIHISLLRKLITGSNVPLVEVLPMPAGGKFFACLTHDVDFAGIRRHRFDHTLFGFLYRAGVNSLTECLRGRLSGRKLKRNWKAILSLPFIHLGLAEDFMMQFDNYAAIEKDLPSTFFLIPFKNCPGKNDSGRRGYRRASRYDIHDVKDEIGRLRSSGREIGLHGIDAWHDSRKGLKEIDQIVAETGKKEIGGRMHWLYYSKDTPRILDEAGFVYDSTYGYNDAVGYRAGTSQVFRPLNAKRLLELPLIMQDTAMFYSCHMGLREEEALALLRRRIADVIQYGGAFTINWHHRSIGPERLWGEVYISMLEELRESGAWFGTATQIAKWFQKRRMVSFKKISHNADAIHVELESPHDSEQPDLILRLHTAASGSDHAIDMSFSGNFVIDMPLRSPSQPSLITEKSIR